MGCVSPHLKSKLMTSALRLDSLLQCTALRLDSTLVPYHDHVVYPDGPVCIGSRQDNSSAKSEC